MKNDKGECVWAYDEDHCKYDTGCDNAFQFITDDIAENGLRFCPFCGKGLVEAKVIDGCITEIRHYDL